MAITTVQGTSGNDLTSLIGSEVADSINIEDNNIYIESLQGNDTISSSIYVDKIDIDTDSGDDTVTFLAEASAIKLKLGAGEDNINLQVSEPSTVETEQTNYSG